MLGDVVYVQSHDFHKLREEIKSLYAKGWRVVSTVAVVGRDPDNFDTAPKTNGIYVFYEEGPDDAA